MKRHVLLLFLMAWSCLAIAQERMISGTLTDRDTNEPAEMLTVQLLRTDSTFVTGTISNEKGAFKVAAPANGKYILRITGVGYNPLLKNVTISNGKSVVLGKLVIGADAIMLQGAVVTAQAQKVTLKEDTFVYNSAAYRTPEGSVVEELVRRIPGAEISDDGTITINGKEVKKIMVDGKEFMTGDTQTALKNLPTNVIEKIKVYDEQSDLARVTGIDDGEEETVLDFGLKKGMNRGTFSNIDLAYGTHSRYAARLMGTYFTDNHRFMLMGSANNTNDMGFGSGGRGRFGGGRQGLNTSKMIGGNYNYEKKDKLKIDASLRWNHRNGDTYTNTSSENFVSTVGSFSNSRRQNYSRSDSWNARMRLEWQPDTMTNIMFRPNFSWSTSDGLTNSLSGSYAEDPYLHVEDPLDQEAIKTLADAGMMVNTSNSNSISYSSSKQISGMLQFNRKIGSKGRNFTLRADGSYNKQDSKSLSTNAVHLYMVQNAMGLDSTYQTNRYNLSPTDNYSYSLQATYSEPLWKGAFLQLRYKFTYNYSKSDRDTYDFSNLGEEFFAGVTPEYRAWNSYLALLPKPWESYLDSDLSRFSEYKNYIHEVQLMLRMIREKYNLNVGVMFQPQTSKYVQDYQGVYVDTTRHVSNFSPTLDFRYRFSKVSNLRVNYRGSSSQPSMTDLLDIVDDSDPLNITMGNPGLKPSFTHRLRVFYNTYIEKHQRSLMTYLNFSTTNNSISSKVSYDPNTGGRTTRPENINGNWSANGAFMFNTAVDSVGYWNVNTFTNVNYNNYVSYLSLDNMSDSQKNTTRTLSLMERLAGSYRNEWLEIELDGSLNYTHARNKLQPSSDLDTWQFSYGANLNINAPWGMSISTDIHQNSRRGYNDSSMNTDELVWNAQVAQSFLPGNPLTVTLQFYDLLHNQSNFSRVINSMSRTDTQYNSINSYAMLHVIYRLNIFGGKEARRQMHQGPDGRRPDFGRPEFRGGRPPMGGPGGGRRSMGFGGPA